MLAVGAASLALLGSSLTVAQAADDPAAVPESSLSTEEDLADPAADELPLAEEDTEGDPESEPSEEDMALGVEGTADEPAAAPDTAEDGQPVTMETGTQTACGEQTETGAEEAPDGQFVACVSPPAPTEELTAEEQAALSRSDATANPSAGEAAALAAAAARESVDREALLQDTTDDTASETEPVDSPDALAAAAKRSPWKEPKWCIDEGVDSTWYMQRMRSCGIWRGKVYAKDVRTGRVVGNIKFLFIGYSFTARDSKTWAAQVKFVEVSRSGKAVSGTKAYGSASCVGKCKVTDKDFPAQTISSRAEPFGQFFMKSTIDTKASKQRGTGRSIATMRFRNSEWLAPSEPLKLSTLEVRCDNALPGAPKQVGCVNLRAVPVISYSTTGPWPQIAKHIKDAQADGKPGKYGTTDYLTRLTNKKKIDKNRGKACPSSLERPPGKSCDEYPFASTWQGAKYSGGPFSRRMVNDKQNKGAGRALKGFYAYSRVLEGDRYLVWIR